VSQGFLPEGAGDPAVEKRENLLIPCQQCGTWIRLQEHQAGKTGRCPKCQSPFIVPPLVRKKSPDGSRAGESDGGSEQQGSVRLFGVVRDVRLHDVDPARLKLIPGSLAAAFREVDLLMTEDGLEILVLVKKSFLGVTGRKKKIVRQQVEEHLQSDQPLDELPVAERISVENDRLIEIALVQPALNEHNSMFAGIPVFGEHRIAVRLPEPTEQGHRRFLSFGLTAFREIVSYLREQIGADDYAADWGVPITDELSEDRCYFTRDDVRAIPDPLYHRADPELNVVVVGYRCGACGIVLSEKARDREKFGGKGGKALAKAICPKCRRPFGNNPLYGVLTSAGDDEAADADRESAEDLRRMEDDIASALAKYRESIAAEETPGELPPAGDD